MSMKKNVCKVFIFLSQLYFKDKETFLHTMSIERLNYFVLLCPVFQGRPQYIQIATINMYLLIELRHNI